MIETLIYMSLFCVGLQISMESGMLLNPIYRYLDKRIKKEWLRKVLIDCMYCFASLWGSIVFWTIQIANDNINGISTVIYWIILTFCCVYVNGIVYSGIKAQK